MNVIKIKKINDAIVRPTRFIAGQGFIDHRPIKGVELFSELYANIDIIAKKKSGKSVVVGKIIRSCATPETTVMVFCSTLDKDKEHLAIKKYCESKNIHYVGYSSLKDEDIDVLDVLIKKLQFDAKKEQEPESDEEEQKGKGIVLFDSSESEEEDDEHKKRKNKFIAPEFIIILDDLSNELKSKTLVKLLKMNRHYKMKVIVSSQYANDLLPESIKQMDYCLLFRGEPEAKLEKLHKDLDLAITIEMFKKIYYNATEKPYSFLYIDVRNELYRRNFTHEYDLSKVI